MTALTPPARAFALLAMTSVGGSVVGQAPPGQPIPTRTAEIDATAREAVKNRIQLGREALAAGRHAEARDHLLSSLAFGPVSPELLLDLLKVSAAAKDPDAQMAWAVRYVAAAADAKGRFKADRHLLALLPKGQSEAAHLAANLAAARAAAVQDLARFVGKLPRGKAGIGNGVRARFAGDLAWSLMRDAPALQREFGGVFRKACAGQVADYQTVLQALRKVASGSIKPKAKGRESVASDKALDKAIIRAARCLTGMGAQAAFKDRKGPIPPAVERDVAAARAARAKIRQKIKKRVGEPMTLAQLYALSPEQQEQFTKEHATWANPGTAVSPKGKYIIRTICGYETLLGVIETIEMHHARLAKWFGKDPFGSRQGLVRIVPASHGLESEDSPFWWAGGFQRGDLTTVKFNWGRHHFLGHALTHELTHRFDGTIYAFLPSWLSEGRAVWTDRSYWFSEEEDFVRMFLHIGPCSSAFVKGYGDPRKLKRLVEGTIDDYRDNYSAGYALFAFLTTWPADGKPLYADRLKNFMSKARAGRKKPHAWFTSNFADGKGGRPADFAAFTAQFREFLYGCYQAGWGKPPAWMGKYRRVFEEVRKVARRGRRNPRVVMDEPTWVWVRARAEPWFGQHHAADAGRLLADLGQVRAATAAFLWSLGTDDWQPRAARQLATLLDGQRYLDVAWLVRAALRRRGFPVDGDVRPSPVLAKLPRVTAYLFALRTTAAAFQAKGFVVCARQALLTHNELAAWVGVPDVAVPERPAKGGEMFPPGGRAGEGSGWPVHLGVHGFTESGLTGYEERRVPGLWYQTANGDLHVGRKKPRKESGLLDRQAHQRHAFVRSAEWFGPGNYSFKTRVRFTTSFVAGAIVLGYSRRDRQIRLNFTAGDFLYSIGRKNELAKTESVSLRLEGRWCRESYLWSRRDGDRFPFDKPTSHFDVEVRVSGPTARVYIDGQFFLAYTTADSSPILGSIGVAMRQGAVRLQSPTVTRLPDRGLALSALGMTSGQRLPGVPRHPNGTLVLWLPGLVEDDDFFDYEEWLGVCLERVKPLLRDRLHYPQRWAVMIPKKLARDTKLALQKMVAKDGFTTAEHDIGKPFTDSIYGLYVDPTGGVRVVTDMLREGVGRPKALERWARVTREPK